MQNNLATQLSSTELLFLIMWFVQFSVILAGIWYMTTVKRGPAGKDGRDGLDGPPGAMGDTGPQGIQGPPGDVYFDQGAERLLDALKKADRGN